jgi:FtsH-binding integral membrane protein
MEPTFQTRSSTIAGVNISRFMSRIYGWMTFGLIITSVVSYVIGSDVGLMQTLMLNRGIFMFLMLLQFGLVIGLSAGINRMSVAVATGCFLLFSFVTGVTFSALFLTYSISTLGNVFAITAGSFGGLALFGYVTKKDLSGLGTFMIMGLWGVIIASIVNIFMHSSALDSALSLISVVIFAGLTAYDTQKLKNFASVSDSESESSHKIAIVGALTLYLDFINLFLALLRVFGGDRRRN